MTTSGTCPQCGKADADDGYGGICAACYYEPGGSDDARPEPRSTSQAWPAPMEAAAYHGLIGKAVRMIEPHTEADPHAVLMQLLAMAGNVIGRGVGYWVESDFHSTALYVTVVGETSKGRKGTSLGRARRLLAEADSEYLDRRIEHGLSSGEGLVYAVRDGVTKMVQPKDSQEWIEETVDPGVEDKRLLILEAEFAQCLKVMSRPGNTLSPAIRALWDHGTAGALTKNNRTNCTNAHVSIVGHAVRDEVRRELSATECGNGFANRFLWCCARRSKLLPDGGDLDEGQVTAMAFEFSRAIAEARAIGLGSPLGRDSEARALWHAVYPTLSEGRPGLLGAVTSRAEAQVMRLACVYAAFDGRHQIGVEHLQAALEVWRYCEDSAKWVFGDATGDPVADEILAALRSRLEGMTRTEIAALLQRHQARQRIDAALASLEAQGLATKASEPTGGRPAERWTAT